METSDFVRNKLTEWGFSEFLQRFEDEDIDKETFLSLGDLGSISVLIPKIGPRVKFRKRLREYLQWNSMETCDFVRDKLTEWDLNELIQRFEDEGIDKETFLGLEVLGNFNDLIPKIGPRVKFRKRLREYLQALKGGHTDTSDMMMDTETGSNMDQEDSLEMDPTIFPWHSASTATSDTDHDNEMTEEPVSDGNLNTGLFAVILFILRHHLIAAMGDLLALLNFLSLDLVLPNYPSDKIPALSPVFYCHVCQKYFGKNPDEASCLHCGTMFNKKDSTRNGHFFLSASLKDLLKDVLKNHGTELLPKKVNNGNDIKDVMDGKMYQNLLKKEILAADDITLSWNCDEVPLYNSVRSSIWPLQFTINELPYMHRKENVIVAGLWFGKEKPKMNTFLKPFIDECRDLAQNPFQWIDNNGTVHCSKVFPLICSSDAVARPLLRNCKQFNGEYDCDWCLHPGMAVGKGTGHMRSYPYDENKQAKRSNEMFRDDAKQAENSDTPKNGVKGLSLLSILPWFDIVVGFIPEYMHSVLLGVSRQLMSLWLDPVNLGKPWYIDQQKVSEMDSRLLHLKPTSETTRLPRSLKCWVTWKASEWRAFLLFYSISVLPGILHPEFLEHYFGYSHSATRINIPT